MLAKQDLILDLTSLSMCVSSPHGGKESIPVAQHSMLEFFLFEHVRFKPPG
jgi:hypothetical protein